MTESTFSGVGGLKIATKSWTPAAKPRAVMVLIHGFNAHSGYMEWPAEQFASHGFAVYALDLRGRGKSEGERFYVEHFSDYLTDVDTLVKRARSENPGLPIYVLGHSAGGVIASSYGTADKATRPAGSQHFYDHAGSTDRTLRLYEGHFHDLLADVDKEKVMTDIQSWLDARIAAA